MTLHKFNAAQSSLHNNNKKNNHSPQLCLPLNAAMVVQEDTLCPRIKSKASKLCVSQLRLHLLDAQWSQNRSVQLKANRTFWRLDDQRAGGAQRSLALVQSGCAWTCCASPSAPFMDCWLFTLAPSEPFPQTGTIESVCFTEVFCQRCLGLSIMRDWLPFVCCRKGSAPSLMETVRRLQAWWLILFSS